MFCTVLVELLSRGKSLCCVAEMHQSRSLNKPSGVLLAADCIYGWYNYIRIVCHFSGKEKGRHMFRLLLFLPVHNHPPPPPPPRSSSAFSQASAGDAGDRKPEPPCRDGGLRERCVSKPPAADKKSSFDITTGATCGRPSRLCPPTLGYAIKEVGIPRQDENAIIRLILMSSPCVMMPRLLACTRDERWVWRRPLGAAP